MATIVNTPGSGDNGSGMGGWIIAGVLLLIIVLIALFVWPGYGRTGDTEGTQINIPDSIDVNIPSSDSGTGEGAQ